MQQQQNTPVLVGYGVTKAEAAKNPSGSRGKQQPNPFARRFVCQRSQGISLTTDNILDYNR